jgi:hypothetical protein
MVHTLINVWWTLFVWVWHTAAWNGKLFKSIDGWTTFKQIPVSARATRIRAICYIWNGSLLTVTSWLAWAWEADIYRSSWAEIEWLKKATSSITEGSWSWNTNYTKTITIPWATVWQCVNVYVSAWVYDACVTAWTTLNLHWWVSSANTVTVRARVWSFITIPTSSNWMVTVA